MAHRSGASSVTKLEEELCLTYKRLLSSEQRLLEALSRIKELEEGEKIREELPSKIRSGTKHKNKANVNLVQVQENDENENKNDGFFQVSVRTTQRKHELKVVDPNMATPKKQHSERTPKSANSKKSDKSVRFAQFSVESPVYERFEEVPATIDQAWKREAAVAILTQQQVPPSSTAKERPPFIPGGGAGNSYFNLHSLKQKRERERKEENRPRHRGVTQQQQSQHPRTPLRNEW